jgi:hypothetical protein
VPWSTKGTSLADVQWILVGCSRAEFGAYMAEGGHELPLTVRRIYTPRRPEFFTKETFAKIGVATARRPRTFEVLGQRSVASVEGQPLIYEWARYLGSAVEHH